METRLRAEHNGVHPNRGGIQPLSYISTPVRHPPPRPQIKQQHHQVLRQTTMNQVAHQRKRRLEPVVEDSLANPDLLPLPNMPDTNTKYTSGYLQLALQQAKTTARTFLSSLRELKNTHIQTTTTLKQVPDGSFILAHPKKDTSTQSTNYIISMAEPVTYAMMSTLTESTKVTLSTNTITKGQIRHQIATPNLTAHTQSILGRTYAQLLVDPDITQLNNNLVPLQFNQTKGFIGRPNDKIT